jgi:surface protein
MSPLGINLGVLAQPSGEELIPGAFAFKIDTQYATTPNEYILPKPVTTPDWYVDWGDGNVEIVAGSTTNPSHTYSTTDEYIVQLYPLSLETNVNSWSILYGQGTESQVTQVLQWGGFRMKSQTFRGCSNLISITAIDTPFFNDFTSTVFFGCSNLTTINNLENWDVSLVTAFQNFFYGCSSLDFGGKLTNWDVSNASNFRDMFTNCTLFNEDIGGWDMSNATNLYQMFINCVNFNQDLPWTVKSNIVSTQGIFEGCTNFNGDLSTWDVSGWTIFINMFKGTNFNNDSILGWDVSSATRMDRMFWDTPFNQDISGWDVSNVTYFGFMFYNNSSFNQDISGWDVSSSTNIPSMFENASAFDQDLSTWNPSLVVNFQYIFRNSGLSITNMENILIGWESQVPNRGLNTVSSLVVTTLTLPAGTSAETAADSLVVNKGWNYKPTFA